jgi:hypothetical protein
MSLAARGHFNLLRNTLIRLAPQRASQLINLRRECCWRSILRFKKDAHRLHKVCQLGNLGLRCVAVYGQPEMGQSRHSVIAPCPFCARKIHRAYRLIYGGRHSSIAQPSLTSRSCGLLCCLHPAHLTHEKLVRGAVELLATASNCSIQKCFQGCDTAAIAINAMLLASNLRRQFIAFRCVATEKTRD